MSAPVTGRHHTAKTIYPDVQNSTFRHEDHGSMSFSKERQVLVQELAVQMKMQKDGTCPIEWMFLPLLDSHKKNRPDRASQPVVLHTIMARP
jgi:hypothetical protein